MRQVFVGGTARSGTTMLGDLLGAHPDHVCLPETSYKVHVIRRARWGRPDADLGAGLELVAQHPKFREMAIPLPAMTTPSLPALFDQLVTTYGTAIGKPGAHVWIDQTPSNIAIGRTLLELFPDARLVHLVRDGRAVAASMLPLDWGPNNVVLAARSWLRTVAQGMALETAYPDRVIRVRFEDLVRDPAPSLARICRFAGLEYREAMTRGGGLAVPKTTVVQHALVGKPPDPRRAEAWKTALTPRQIEIFESEVRSLLPLLGYEPVYGESARPLTPLGGLLYHARHLARDVVVNRLRRRKRMAS
jgi:hypothetical protein